MRGFIHRESKAQICFHGNIIQTYGRKLLRNFKYSDCDIIWIYRQLMKLAYVTNNDFAKVVFFESKYELENNHIIISS